MMRFRPKAGAALIVAVEPTLAQVLHNFTAAMGKFIAAGCPVVTEVAFRARVEACDACPHWSMSGPFAHCRKCGCSRLKLWLATERCPDKPPRWKL